jgi:ADP-heptose:LPS heptosyltransferase
MNPKRILISRTDSIGDVMLTLPICAWLKNTYPEVELLFLGKGYTLPIIKSYSIVDECLDWNDFEHLSLAAQVAAFKKLNLDVIIHVFPNREIAKLAKKAGIKMRIGTSHRSFHLLTCNYRPNFSRKRSDKHEAVLNHELLRPLGLKLLPTLEELKSTTAFFQVKEIGLPDAIQTFINGNKNYILLHPKSQGSALEWPIEKYVKLAKELVSNATAVIFTGTESEGKQFKDFIPNHPLIFDSTGLLTLPQLLWLIKKSEGIVACSTGPLHLGSFLGIKAIGLFSSRKPIHPGRWQSIGVSAKALVYDENCTSCKQGKACKCIEEIEVGNVLRFIRNSL